MQIPINEIGFDEVKLRFLEERDITLKVMRLDKIHDIISGNKLFKLHYYIENCLQTTTKTILTFGGAYSNHLVATAHLCKLNGIKCIGIVRGQNYKSLTHTLQKCEDYGMQLQFVNAIEYKKLNELNIEKYLATKYNNCTVIPEGGFGLDGAKGASLIMNYIKDATHVCTSVGTATTLAGLLMNSNTVEKILVVPAIKNMTDIENRIENMKVVFDKNKLEILHNYDFGGYAKFNNKLIQFMNDFFIETTIPTDFVYTAKLMYAIMDRIKNDYFKPNSKIVCLHTGGLQGNLSIEQGILLF